MSENIGNSVIIDRNGDWKKYKRGMRRVDNESVKCGIFGNTEQSFIATIQEFGATIKVTEKMRAFLHHKGIHLRKDTTHIEIPSRPFLRNTMDKNKERLDRINAEIEYNVLRGYTVQRALEEVGVEVVSLIKKEIKELKDPPKSDATLKMQGEGKNNPLINTGSMRQSVDYEVE